MWGFCHSTLVTVPVNVTGLLASNSAAKEWCASTGTAARSRPRAATKTEIFLISSLHAKFTVRQAIYYRRFFVWESTIRSHSNGPIYLRIRTLSPGTGGPHD